MSGVHIRDAIWPKDRAAAERFIDGLQRHEHRFEPNRRVDAAVAAEYFDVLLEGVARNAGIVRVAEADGRALGWAVGWPETDALYVVEAERRYFYISELYVEEGLRGKGIGRALIASCEDWARAQDIRIARIGVIHDNDGAAATYARAGYAPYAARLTKRIG
jgi:GNAT superfamily N-acetyltransferase